MHSSGPSLIRLPTTQDILQYRSSPKNWGPQPEQMPLVRLRWAQTRTHAGHPHLVPGWLHRAGSPKAGSRWLVMVQPDLVLPFLVLPTHGNRKKPGSISAHFLFSPQKERSVYTSTNCSNYRQAAWTAGRSESSSDTRGQPGPRAAAGGSGARSASGASAAVPSSVPVAHPCYAPPASWLLYASAGLAPGQPCSR